MLYVSIGYDCYLYKMVLVFDGEYRSCLISQFRVMRDAQGLMLLLPAINVLSYLKVMDPFFKKKKKKIV
jgi:hypothetical protein